MGHSLNHALRCTSCGAAYSFSVERKLCDRCGQGLTLDMKPSFLEEPGEHGVWRHGGILPAVEKKFRISLGEGNTMLRQGLRIGRSIGIEELWIKDETVEPTGSYLDRSSALFVSIALSLGYGRVSTYSTGNLGASLAAYSSKAGLKTHVQVKPTIDVGKLYQMIIYGAEVSVVDFFGKRAAKGAIVAVEHDPLINEAKKTIMLEILLQLGGRPPDYVVLPMGEGGLVYETYKMMRELRELGIAKCSTRIVGVQPEDCNPIVNAFERGLDTVEAEAEPRSRIFDLNVANPRFGNAALRAIRQTGGMAVSVSEKEIFEALSLLAEKEGILAEPAGSLSTAGLVKLVKNGEVKKDARVVSVVTGSGLKDPRVMKELAYRKSSIGVLIEELSGGVRLGSTKTAILRLLSEKNMYGYEVWRGLREKYGMNVRIPTVYQHLSDLVEKGYVRRVEARRVMGRKREYYSLTERGEAIA